MDRFIVRYRGKGSPPAETIQILRAIDGAKVVDNTGKMILIDAPEQSLRTALASSADWLIAPEVTYTLPDTRKKTKHDTQFD